MARKIELWGIEEFAEALGITANTAHQWRYRGKLPDPDWIISNRPIWLASRARRWITAQARKEKP